MHRGRPTTPSHVHDSDRVGLAQHTAADKSLPETGGSCHEEAALIDPLGHCSHIAAGHWSARTGSRRFEIQAVSASTRPPVLRRWR